MQGCAGKAPPKQSRPPAPRKGAKASPSPCDQLWERAQAYEKSLQGGKEVPKSELKGRARKAGACPDTGRVAFAMGLALLWGRAAQGRGLGGLTAFRRAESWAAKAYERDPEFQEGMPRRVLGTMWALGGQHLPGKDSESGLELLMEQMQRYPQGDENALRLVQALLALGDLEGGHEIYCAYSALPEAWNTLHVEGQAEKGRIEASFAQEALHCPAPSEVS